MTEKQIEALAPKIWEKLPVDEELTSAYDHEYVFEGITINEFPKCLSIIAKELRPHLQLEVLNNVVGEQRKYLRDTEAIHYYQNLWDIIERRVEKAKAQIKEGK